MDECSKRRVDIVNALSCYTFITMTLEPPEDSRRVLLSHRRRGEQIGVSVGQMVRRERRDQRRRW